MELALHRMVLLARLNTIVIVSDSWQYLCTIASYHPALHPESFTFSGVHLIFTFDPVCAISSWSVTFSLKLFGYCSRCYWWTILWYVAFLALINKGQQWIKHACWGHFHFVYYLVQPQILDDLVSTCKCAFCKYGKWSHRCWWLHTPT